MLAVVKQSNYSGKNMLQNVLKYRRNLHMQTITSNQQGYDGVRPSLAKKTMTSNHWGGGGGGGRVGAEMAKEPNLRAEVSFAMRAGDAGGWIQGYKVSE